ncbi:MAG TPA: hypothetical protein H9881_12175 [Candidatus Stackebrandtia excrementipullorum]|nr:hypothetical protein [Candidatus Stackebrandtia excrementipullorum]
MTEIKRALELQARLAPEPDGLLDRVRSASARRQRIRRGSWAVGVVVLVVGAVGISTVPWHSNAPSPAAEGMGTGDVAVCMDVSGGDLSSLTITEWAWGDRIDTRTEEFTGEQPIAVDQPVVGADHTVTVSVREGDIERLLPSGRPVDVSGRSGIADTADGIAVVVFESGVDDMVIRLSGTDTELTEEQLIDWASAVTVHTDTSACAP